MAEWTSRSDRKAHLWICVDEASESLGLAPIRPMMPAGTMKVVEFEPLLSAEPDPPMRVTTPVVAAPPVMLEMVQPAPGVELVASAPALTIVAPAPVVEFVVPAPAVLHAASAPVDVCVAPILESGRM